MKYNPLNIIWAIWDFIVRFWGAHFKAMSSLLDGIGKMRHAFQNLSIACVVIGGVTSLAYVAPIVAYYVESTMGGPGWSTTILTIAAVVLGSYLIDISAAITVPFAVDLIASIMKGNTAHVKDEYSATTWLKKHVPGWYGLFSFVLQFIALRAANLLAIGTLVIAMSQGAASVYFTWNGNAAAAVAFTEKDRPKEDSSLVKLDSARKAEIASLRRSYDNKISALESKDKVKSLDKKAANIIANAEAKAKKQFGPSMAEGNGWAQQQYDAAIATAKAHADSTVYLPVREEIATLKAERDREIATTTETYDLTHSGKVDDLGKKKDLYEGIRFGIMMWAQYLGVAATLVFWIVVILAAISKHVDFQSITKAAKAAATKTATIFTTHNDPSSDDDDNIDDNSYRSESEIRKDCTDNFSNIGKPSRKDSTIAKNIISLYSEYYNSRKAFYSNNGISDADAEQKADADVAAFIISLENKYPGKANPNILDEIERGLRKFN